VSEEIVSAETLDAFQSHLGQASTHLRDNNVEAALVELGSALELVPDDRKALGLTGLAHFRASDYESALPVYGKLVALAPEEASYRLNLGLVHLKLGNAEAAVEQLSQSRELDSTLQRTISYLGLAYARLGDYASAFEAFLTCGQKQLASEMEQNLEDDEVEEIRARVGGVDENAQTEVAPVVSLDAEEPTEDGPIGDVDDFAEAVFDAIDELAGKDEEATREAVSDSDIVGERDDSRPGVVAVPMARSASGVVNLPQSRSGVVNVPMSRSASGVLDMPKVPPGSDEATSAPDVVVPPAGAITQAMMSAQPFEPSGPIPVPDGRRPTLPLIEFATQRLIRPEEGSQSFEIGAGGVLIVRIDQKVMSRTEEVIVSGGELGFEPATRKVRGASTDEIFGDKDRQMFIVTGHGYLVASPAGQCFAAMTMQDDILYMREDLVFAFEDSINWESGRVPGSEINVVQFRGEGSVAIRTAKPLLSVKLAMEAVIYVEARVLAGWVGRVIPRLVSPAAGGESSALFVECSGEGVVLIEDLGSK